MPSDAPPNKSLFSLAIVDDEEKILHGLVHYVDWPSMGFRVKASFEDGKDALEYLLSRPTDAVLTDIKMTDVSGLDIAAALVERRAETRVVLMSGYREFDYARRAVRCDVFDYLIKPVEIETLKEVFTRLYGVILEHKGMKRFRDMLPMDEEGFLKAVVEGRPGSEEELHAIIDAVARRGSSDGAAGRKGYAALIIRRAQEYIGSNFARDIALEEIAAHVHLSPGYFCRFFREETGTHFTEYLTHVRLRKAVELLRSPGRRIGEVSRLVGYRSSKYFARVFKKAIGVTPSSYVRHDRIRPSDRVS